MFLTSENEKTHPAGVWRDSGGRANRTVLCRAGKRAVYPKDGFGPQVQYCRHFLTLHRTPILDGKAPIPETVVTFQAPRRASERPCQGGQGKPNRIATWGTAPWSGFSRVALYGLGGPRDAPRNPRKPRRSQTALGTPRKLQEAPGGLSKSLEAPGNPRRLREDPERSRRSQEALGGPRKPQEVPGGSRRSQESPSIPPALWAEVV